MNQVISVLKQSVDLILPYRCGICGKVSDCAGNMSFIDRRYEECFGSASDIRVCGRCLSSLRAYKPADRWHLCLSNPFAGDEIPGQVLYIAMPYQGLITRAVPRIKFSGRRDIARLMGIVLAEMLRDEKITADMAVPVPLSEQRLEQRGFNQAEEIGRPVAAVLGLPLVTDCLIRSRNTGRQTETKDNYDRYENIRDAFEVSDSWDIEGLTIVLIDDVATTGFTMHEAALALYHRGVGRVLCVALAGNRQVKNADPF
ncbi:MAG: hypothetical protein K5745_07475 [Saccharofermentans sp.]|nr:hypothetical protein [Saccharofermentans sp.]